MAAASWQDASASSPLSSERRQGKQYEQLAKSDSQMIAYEPLWPEEVW